MEKLSKIFKSSRGKKKKNKSKRESIFQDVDQVRSHLEEHLQADAKMQAHIKYLYNELYVYILMKLSEKSVIQQLDLYAPNFLDNLKTTIENFDQLECPIVVAGETSAGKSSILNLFLGESILPVSLVRATSTVCHISNGERKTVTVVHDDGHEEQYDTRKSRHSTREIMDKHVLRQSGTSKKEVFIKWPVPFLKGRLTIVDTPGISEPDMSAKVRDILPRAAAFIYVINTMNAGGVLLDGTLFELLKTQSSQEETIEHLPVFDPTSAIFVLNKWDGVPAGEEGDVEEVVFENLQMCWPGLQKDQIYQLSAKEEEKGMVDVKKHTEKFKKLCHGIQKLIPVGLKLNTKSQFKRLWNILKYLERIVNMRLENARKSKEEKKKEIERLNLRSSLLMKDINKIIGDIKSMLSRKSDEIASTMLQYFRFPDVVAKITKWTDDDAPRGTNINEIQKDINCKVRKRINAELEQFVDKSDFYTNTLQEIYKTLEEKLQLVDRELKLWETEMACFQGQELVIQGTGAMVNVFSEEIWYTQAIESFLGTTIGKEIPFLMPSNYIVTLMSIAVTAAMEVKQKLEMTLYNRDRAGFMAQRTRDALKNMDQHTIRANVVDKMMDSLWKTVSMIERNIPRLIEADKIMINDVLTDLRDMNDIIRGYQKPKRFCRSFKAKLILFRLQHFSTCTISNSDIEYTKRVGSGAYSNVYEATYKSDLVAVKDFHGNNHESNEIYYQCLEVDLLMSLKHPNIVDLYGVVFDESEANRQPRIKLVMELCDNCLWDQIQDNPNGALVPAKQKRSSKLYETAEKFYCHTLKQILEGLSFIHSKGYVHRDLKLANILMKGDTIKISDVGMSVAEDDITGTACGTVSHMAPEVLARKPYGQSADIFSMSILMWELWYGVYSYDEYTRDELITDVRAGYRPNFAEHERPPDKLQKLIKSCWNDNAHKRPTADECLQQTQAIFKGSRRSSFLSFLS